MPTNYRVTFRVVREPNGAAATTLFKPSDVAALAESLIPDDAREHFGVLLLDSKNQLVAYHEVSTGTLSASLVHPREVIGPALRVMGVAAMILVHNHPSGVPEPSHEDIRLTRQLVECARLFDIPIHDHVIIGTPGRHVSLAERGLI